MSFSSNLKKLRDDREMTQEQLAAALDISKSSISMYELGNRQPDFETLELFADHFNVDMNFLLGKASNISTPFPTPDRNWGEPLLDAYAEAEKPTQFAACNVLQIPYVDPENHEAEPETEVFRISDQPAAAGTGVYLGPESFHEVYINVNKLPKNAIFGIPIQGNSMEPRFHDGEVVIVTREEPRIGEIGVFTTEGQGYLKQLGEGRLLSLNSSYNPIPMDESIRCNGKVVGVLQEEWIVG